MRQNMRLHQYIILAVVTGFLAACAGGYTLINAAAPVKVASGEMTVTPSVAWNRVPRRVDQPRYEEVWTADGTLLNSVTFYAGVPEGQALIKQRKKSEKQAPLFKANMLPQEVAEFFESTYRVVTGSSVFTFSSLKPVTFSGAQGFQMDFDYIVQSDEVKRKGRAVGVIKNNKLYLVVYEGTATHYYDLYASEFDKVVASVKIAGTGA